ncbi:MAG: chemotaxis protein CheX [Calditrichaeota bacterium]|nr:chemotaxis protein CheX [Calditrichota bacterium]
MNDYELKQFIESTLKFFNELTQKVARCGIPFVKNNEPIVLEYTGIIGISGKRKGSIYYTAEKDQLAELAKIMLAVDSVSDDDIKDLAGEIANTISGNLREVFGSDFLISVPVIVEGRARDIKLPERIDSYVIPISWENKKSFLVVCLE